MFKADTPPEADLQTLAAWALAWRKGLPNELTTFEWLAPKLRAYLDDQDASLDPQAQRELTRFQLALGDAAKRWDDHDPQQRWELFRERLVLRRVAFTMERSYVEIGSLRTLKERIDSEIREATLLMSAIPAMALVVAALGVANLMMVNVSSGELIGIAGESVIPWGQVAGGVALTVIICLLAGIAPARHAARNNIIDAIAAQ